MPLLSDSMTQSVEIAVHDIGISIVNDISHEELLYISFNRSKVIWTEAKRTRVKPLSNEYNKQLEEEYQKHLEERELDPSNKQLLSKKYQSEDFRVNPIGVSFIN